VRGLAMLTDWTLRAENHDSGPAGAKGAKGARFCVPGLALFADLKHRRVANAEVRAARCAVVRSAVLPASCTHGEVFTMEQAAYTAAWESTRGWRTLAGNGEFRTLDLHTPERQAGEGKDVGGESEPERQRDANPSPSACEGSIRAAPVRKRSPRDCPSRDRQGATLVPREH
jgi:hypothetical protein